MDRGIILGFRRKVRYHIGKACISLTRQHLAVESTLQGRHPGGTQEAHKAPRRPVTSEAQKMRTLSSKMQKFPRNADFTGGFEGRCHQ